MSESLLGYLVHGDWELEPIREEEALMTGHEQSCRLADVIDLVLASHGRTHTLGETQDGSDENSDASPQQAVYAVPPFETTSEAIAVAAEIASAWQAACDELPVGKVSPYDDTFVPRV